MSKVFNRGKGKSAQSRREFLKLAATTTPLAAVAVTTCTDEVQAAEPDLTSDKMQDTAHTRAYYDSTRF